MNIGPETPASTELTHQLSPIEQLGRTKALVRQRDIALFEVVCLTGEIERLNAKLKDYSDALQIAGERRQELQLQLGEALNAKTLHAPHSTTLQGAGAPHIHLVPEGMHENVTLDVAQPSAAVRMGNIHMVDDGSGVARSVARDAVQNNRAVADQGC